MKNETLLVIICIICAVVWELIKIRIKRKKQEKILYCPVAKEPKYKVTQQIFCGEFKTYVWNKCDIIKMYSRTIPVTQEQIDIDLNKAKELAKELEQLKF